MPLKFVSLEQLRVHTKADGEDDEMLMLYGEAAEEFCVAECQLNVYPTQAELDTALGACPDLMRAAKAARESAFAAADAEDDADVAAYIRNAANLAYRDSMFKIERIERGRVVGPSFLAAVLLIAGHLYRNREEVSSGINHGSTKLPVGYNHMLHKFTRYGV